MKRIGIIVVAVLVVVVGGWSAVWFANKSSAEATVRGALEQLDRAGAANTYDAISVAGFPFAYRGEVDNLAFQTESATVIFPTVAAEISVAAQDTVVFTMPERFEVRPNGSLSGIQVRSKGFSAQVVELEGDAYDFALEAETLAVYQDDDPAKGALEVTALTGSGSMEADPAAEKVSLAIALGFDEAAFKSMDPGGPMPPGSSFAISGLAGEVNGSLQELSSTLTAERLLLDAPGQGAVEAVKPSYVFTVKAKERFDPAPLAGAQNFETALQAFLQMAAAGVAEGGELTFDWSMAGLQGSGEVDGRPNSADISDIGFGLAFGPKKVGMSFDAERFLIDIDSAEDDTKVYYALDKVSSKLEATPADAFDFADVTAAMDDPDRLSEALFTAIGAQIAEGGSFEYSDSSGGGVVRGSAPPMDGVEFGRFSYEVGPGSNRIAVNPDEAVVLTKVDTIAFELSDGFEAAGSLAGYELNFQAPLRAQPTEQKATLLARVDQLELTDSIWDLLDPENALEREVKGMRLQAEAGLTIQRDILSPEADLYNIANPPAFPGRLTISDSFLDVLGLRADLAGGVAVFPIPDGELDLDVVGWRKFFEDFQKTTIAQDPQAMTTLLIANDIISRYGKPADETDVEADALRFDIKIGGPSGIMVNGEPYGG